MKKSFERFWLAIFISRNLERGEEAAREIAAGSINVKVKKCDLASFASVREFCRQINKEERKVDILINNAGMVTMERQLTEDGQEMQFQSNHLGHFLLTNLLLDKLKASKRGGRIINVSSVGHRYSSCFITQLSMPFTFFLAELFSSFPGLT